MNVSVVWHICNCWEQWIATNQSTKHTDEFVVAAGWSEEHGYMDAKEQWNRTDRRTVF